MENRSTIQIKLPVVVKSPKEKSVQCSIDESPPRQLNNLNKRDISPKIRLGNIEKLLLNGNMKLFIKKYFSPVQIIPKFLRTRSSFHAKKPENFSFFSKNQKNYSKTPSKEKTIMEYYYNLAERPNRPKRTRYNFHKEVSCTNGYRTKLQKDPKITRDEHGKYIYIDTYNLDAKKQSKIIMSLALSELTPVPGL
jgi:hypothetical protein